MSDLRAMKPGENGKLLMRIFRRGGDVWACLWAFVDILVAILGERGDFLKQVWYIRHM
jgi:hypothetical protein